MIGRLLALLVVGYQRTVGRLFGGRCRFYPSCSDYAVQALRMNGAARGGAQAAWRILRCGPWTDGGIDHPAPRRGAHRHDAREEAHAAHG